MQSERVAAPKKIIACVDGSEVGFKAADFALALASKMDSQLFFVNVVGASAKEPSYRISADMVGSFETLGEEALRRCREKAGKYGVRFDTRKLEGEPVDEILKLAKETQCDCIVVGRKGIGGLEKLLLGSVSEKILKLSDVTVVVVK
jgi:nucleotide-binding universal stress UspA family protein